ncbi:MAG TPA: glycosyltransferase family 4 protein [Bryobacteraceae bacterium]|jgi:glycosyltransferase involved in cell wall biosynthesis|nr:glycosyltransferase family 4 protein [Bryobacteraceae bacterium]
MRPKVLMAHPYIGTMGGGNVVGAWALQALREEFDVILATLGPVDCDGLNRNFGTSLRPGDFDIRIAPTRHQALLHLVPTPGALLEIAVTTRWIRTLAARERPDALLSTHNEMDFGRPGLQYIHYPWAYLPRPDVETRWFHRLPGFLPAYRGLCQAVAGGTKKGRAINLSLANSGFVAAKIKEVYGTDSAVLYPPVPGNFPDVPWEERRSAVVAIGRMHPIKRWDMAVKIVEEVRRRGVDLGLTLITQPDVLDYGRRLERMAASRPWLRLLSGLSRDDLAREVAQHRYGIHTMEAEHFGIAVAEILRAGCLPFVHDSGGPVEIVGGRRELRFGDVGAGVDALSAVIGDAALQEQLRTALGEQRDLFTVESFCESLRRHVRSYCR